MATQSDHRVVLIHGYLAGEDASSILLIFRHVFGGGLGYTDTSPALIVVGILDLTRGESIVWHDFDALGDANVVWTLSKIRLVKFNAFIVDAKIHLAFLDTGILGTASAGTHVHSE